MVVQESLEALSAHLRETTIAIHKERLQMLYWLKQDNAPSISSIAQALGRHRGTLQTWLARYRDNGLCSLLEVKLSLGGGNRVIPQWAEAALAKRLEEPDPGFSSYGAVQQWLSQTLGIEATYHAVYQLTHYRLHAKLKVPRPQHHKQNKQQRESFKQTLAMTSKC
jgi:transposase